MEKKKDSTARARVPRGPYYNEALPTRIREDRMARRISWAEYWALVRAASPFKLGQMTIWRTANGRTSPHEITCARIEDALNRLPAPDVAPRPRRTRKMPHPMTAI
jgi:hypothetical protein